MSGGSIVWILDADSGKFSQALIQAEDQAEKTGTAIDRSLGRATEKTSSRLGDLSKSLASTAWGVFNVGVVGATTALTALISKGFSSGLQLQSLQIQMEGLTKSMQLGSKAMAGAYEFAKRSPFQLPEVAQSTKTLIAFGMNVDSAVKSLDLLGNISITSGVGLSHIASIFGRVSAQGRVMGGDIQQLTENGIAILPALQKTLGKTADEVREMASDGQINFEVFRKAMESIVDPKIVEKLENTLPRQLDRLGGSIRILSGSLVGYTVDVNNGFKLMEGSLIQSVTDLMREVNNSLRAEPLLEAAGRFGKSMSPVIDTVTEFFKVAEGETMSQATEVLTKFFDILADLGPALIPILGALAISSTQFLQGLPLIGPALSPLGTSFNNAALGALSFLNPFSLIGGRSKEVSGGLGETGGALSKVSGFFTSTRDSAGGLVSKLQGLSNPLPGLKSGFDTFGGAVRETGSNILTAGNKFPAFSSAVATTTGTFWNASDAVSGFASKMNPIPSIIERTSGPVSFLSDKFGFFGDILGNVGGKLGKITQIFAPLTSLLPSLSGVMGGLGTAAGVFGNGLQFAGGAMMSMFSIIGKALLVLGPFALLLGVAAAAIGFFAKETGTHAADIQAKIDGMVREAISGIRSFIESIPAIIEGVTSAIAGIVDNIATFLPMLVKAGVQIIDALIEGVISNMPAIIDALINLQTELVNAITTTLPMLVEAGVELLLALVDGFVQALPAMIEGAKNAVLALIQTLVEVLPMLFEAGVELILGIVNGLLSALPDLIDAAIEIVTALLDGIVEVLPKLLEAGAQLLLGLVTGIVEALPQIIEAVAQIAQKFIESIVIILPLLLQAGVDLLVGILKGIVDNLPLIITAVVSLITTLLNALITALPMLLQAGIEILMALIQGIIDNLPAIIEAINTLITTLLQAIVDNLPMIIEGAVTLITTLAESMSTNLPLIIEAIFKIIVAIVQVLLQNLPLLIQAAIEIVIAITVGLAKAIPSLLKAVWNLGAAILKGLWEGVKGIADVGVNIVKGIWEGISSMGSWIKDKVVQFVKDKIPGPIRKALGIQSPSKVFMGIGHYMMEGLVKGITREGSGLVKASQSIAEQVTSAFASLNGSNAISYSASLEDNIPRDITSLNRAVGLDYGITGQGPNGTGAVINQTNNVYTEIDMEQINRDLAWELSKA